MDDAQALFSRLTSAHSLYANMNSFITTITNRISTTSPDLKSIALVLIVLFISLKVLGMLYRAIMFWVKLIFRVAVFFSLGMIGVWMYTRGPEGALEDATHWKTHWETEYQRWSRQQKLATAFGGAAKRQGFWDALF
jgi:hypothetical protein